MYMSITVIKIKDRAKKWARVPLCKSIRENRQKARRNWRFQIIIISYLYMHILCLHILMFDHIIVIKIFYIYNYNRFV